jgi:hypothetical protein
MRPFLVSVAISNKKDPKIKYKGKGRKLPKNKPNVHGA